ncbi:threonine aldolase family protein [Edaphobacter modestus]|uniref:L-threonine aldolase n=1 Tax=Edaphobacter modestus TaxID=388466 RepID=A0A4Q7YUI4_9BACT|nr:beta-eliminating lyase-related protein [Edaphobacter modestus]RZU40964.1 L-threonine aldolase [Edaphobacter modestus]
MNLDRRDFLRAALPAGATATGLFNASAWQPLFAQATASHAPEAPITERTVGLDGDSPPRTYEQHIVELQRLMAKGPYPDVYLKGGAVTEFEQRMASLLGKEDAAFFPTGTLANNIAVRLLCGERRNLLIQHEAHLYQDEGEGPSLLSGINMIPLAPGKPCPSIEEITAALETAQHSAYYPTSIGAISIESPVRRQNGACVPYAEAEKITSLARSKNIGTHLDGSRLFLLSGTPGFQVRTYCALFDTVFVSIYKFFGAPFGAILAGNKDLIARAKELRHTFGGLIYHGWIAALPALAACDGFEARFTQARLASEKLLNGLAAADGFTVERIPNGSNISLLHVSPKRAQGLTERLAKADIRILPTHDGTVKIYFNESILRQPTGQILAAFLG